MPECSFSGFEKRVLTRRTLLKSGILLLAGTALPNNAFARLAMAFHAERALSFHNTHTGESLDRVVFWANGKYLPEHLKRINYILRDHRTNEVKRIDPGLLNILYSVQRSLHTTEPLHIVSGFRSKSSNAKLRRASGGVARKSLHVKGQAIDFRIPGRDLRDIRNAATVMAQGGVGYYPASEFVHLDTGPFRTW